MAEYGADRRPRTGIRRLVAYHAQNLVPGQHAGLPSTTLTLVLPLDDKLDVSLNATRGRYAVSLAGLHTTPATIHYGTAQIGYQLALDPLACRSLFGVPAAELTNAITELDAVTGRLAGTLLDAAGSASSMPAGCTAIDDLLPTAHADGVRPEVAGAWRRILRSGGAIGIEEVARAVGWSRRHLETEFRRELGITPKQACRLRRFEVAHALVRDARDLADVAALAGFADQPHLNREWRALAGASPTQWRRSEQLAFVQDTAYALGRE